MVLPPGRRVVFRANEQDRVYAATEGCQAGPARDELAAEAERLLAFMEPDVKAAAVAFA